MNKTILVVEHDPEKSLMLKKHLMKEGFQVWLANNKHEALSMALEEPPTLILLDLMLPELEGYRFLQHYRRRRNTPIISMTAKEQESEAVMALEFGADDVVTKPLRMHELVARIHAVLQRTHFQVIDRLQAEDVVLDRANGTVTVRQTMIHLTHTEFHLLAILMNQAGHVIPRQTLFEGLIKKGYTGSESSIKVHIRNLRKKIEVDPNYPSYINTIFGSGYRFGQPKLGYPLFGTGRRKLAMAANW